MFSAMGDVNAITRGCAQPPFDKLGCVEGETLGINGMYCVCDSTLCNFDVTSGSTIKELGKFIVLILIMFHIFNGILL